METTEQTSNLPSLMIKKRQIADLLERIKQKKEAAIRANEKLQNIQSNLNITKSRIRTLSKYQRDINRLNVVLEEVQKSVESMSILQLNEITKYNNPPEVIKIALEGILYLLKGKRLMWPEIRKEITRGNFIKDVIRFKVAKANPEVLKVIQDNYIMQDKWNLERLRKASKAMGPLGEWLQCQVELYDASTKNEDAAQFLQARECVTDLEESKHIMYSIVEENEAEAEELELQVAQLQEEVQELEFLNSQVDSQAEILDKVGDLIVKSSFAENKGSLAKKKVRFANEQSDFQEERTKKISILRNSVAKIKVKNIFQADNYLFIQRKRNPIEAYQLFNFNNVNYLGGRLNSQSFTISPTNIFQNFKTEQFFIDRGTERISVIHTIDRGTERISLVNKLDFGVGRASFNETLEQGIGNSHFKVLIDQDTSPIEESFLTNRFASNPENKFSKKKSHIQNMDNENTIIEEIVSQDVKRSSKPALVEQGTLVEELIPEKQSIGNMTEKINNISISKYKNYFSHTQIPKDKQIDQGTNPISIEAYTMQQGTETEPFPDKQDQKTSTTNFIEEVKFGTDFTTFFDKNGQKIDPMPKNKFTITEQWTTLHEDFFRRDQGSDALNLINNHEKGNYTHDLICRYEKETDVFDLICRCEKGNNTSDFLYDICHDNKKSDIVSKSYQISDSQKLIHNESQTTECQNLISKCNDETENKDHVINEKLDQGTYHMSIAFQIDKSIDPSSDFDDWKKKQSHQIVTNNMIFQSKRIEIDKLEDGTQVQENEITSKKSVGTEACLPRHITIKTNAFFQQKEEEINRSDEGTKRMSGYLLSDELAKIKVNNMKSVDIQTEPLDNFANDSINKSSLVENSKIKQEINLMTCNRMTFGYFEHKNFPDLVSYDCLEESLKSVQKTNVPLEMYLKMAESYFQTTSNKIIRDLFNRNSDFKHYKSTCFNKGTQTEFQNNDLIEATKKLPEAKTIINLIGNCTKISTENINEQQTVEVETIFEKNRKEFETKLDSKNKSRNCASFRSVDVAMTRNDLLPGEVFRIDADENHLKKSNFNFLNKIGIQFVDHNFAEDQPKIPYKPYDPNFVTVARTLIQPDKLSLHKENRITKSIPRNINLSQSLTPFKFERTTQVWQRNEPEFKTSINHIGRLAVNEDGDFIKRDIIKSPNPLNYNMYNSPSSQIDLEKELDKWNKIPIHQPDRNLNLATEKIFDPSKRVPGPSRVVYQTQYAPYVTVEKTRETGSILPLLKENPTQNLKKEKYTVSYRSIQSNQPI